MSSAEFETLSCSSEQSDGLEDNDYDIEQTLRSSHNVQSPRIVLPRRKSCGTCIGCLVSIILVSAIIGFCLTWEEDSIPTQTHLEARVGGAWPRTYHYFHKPSCNQDGIDCCHIHDKNQDYIISPIRIVKRDKSGSNCPSLSTLVSQYNDNHIRYFGMLNCSAINCCSIDIYWDELVRNNRTVKEYLMPIEVSKEAVDTCPTIKTLISKYENYYQETDSTLVIIALCILVVCWLCHVLQP